MNANLLLFKTATWTRGSKKVVQSHGSTVLHELSMNFPYFSMVLHDFFQWYNVVQSHGL